MKKAKSPDHDIEMRPEYDFSKGIRGKYWERFRQGSNVVVLDPDIAKVFKTSKMVNDALRTLSAKLSPKRR
jgi:hypothetical protein